MRDLGERTGQKSCFVFFVSFVVKSLYHIADFRLQHRQKDAAGGRQITSTP